MKRESLSACGLRRQGQVHQILNIAAFADGMAFFTSIRIEVRGEREGRRTTE